MNALILAEKWALSASFTWLAAVTLAQWLRFRTRINRYPALAVGLLASVLLAGNLSTLGGPSAVVASSSWLRVAVSAVLVIAFLLSGTHNGVKFTSYWNTDVVPAQGGAQHGAAQGMLALPSGEFTTGRAEGEAGFERPDLYVAEGTIVFADHGTGALADLRGRSGRFRFEEDPSGNYVQRFTFAD